MFSVTDFFKLIPDSLKQTAVDALVDAVVERGEGLLSESLLGKIKGLRTDAAFRRQLDAGLQRGLQRFIDEYQLEDEDLVTAVVQSPALFTSVEVRSALITIIRQPSHYLSEEQSQIGQSFASVLPERINRERVDRAIAYLLRCLARELWHLPELQPIYSLEFQRITAESTREQLAVQKAQLAALDNLGAGVRDALLQLTEALSEQKQLSAGYTTPVRSMTRPAVYHNLPQPDYGEFVGREAELARIFELLRPYPLSIDHRIVVDGIGGIGKSSLALEVAYRCLQASLRKAKPEEQDYLVGLRQVLEQRFNEEELRTLCFDMALDYDMLPAQGKGGKARELVAYLDRRNRLPELIELMQRTRPDIDDGTLFAHYNPEVSEAEQFDAIIWTSAKRLVLTGEGIAIRHQTTSTLHDIYRAIAVALEREDILRARPEEQPDIVRHTLTRQRTLLILDNLETIDDEKVMSFLQELPAPTKVLITTRHRISTAVPVRLSGMAWEDARSLIHQECARKETQLSDHEARRLYDRTGGLPLAIIWSIAQIGFGYGIQNVLSRLGNPTNDVVRFCFEGAVERLRNRPAHKLLLACAMFTNDVSRDGLRHATDLPPLDLDDGLVELERLSLVNKKADRFSLLSLTRVFALAELNTMPDFAQEARSRWMAHLKSFYQEPQNEYHWRYSNFDFYQDGENILEAVEWAYQEEKAEDVFHLAVQGFYYLEFLGDWNRLIPLLQQALNLAELTGDKVYIARLANTLGSVFSEQGEYNKALDLHMLSLKIYRDRISLRGTALTLQQQSTVLRKLAQYPQAKDLLNEADHIADVLEDGDLKALIEANFGKLARNMGEWELAWEHFMNVRDYFDRRTIEWPRDEFLARSIWGHLASVAIHLNRPQQAKEYCLRSIEYYELEGPKGILSTLKYRLALAEQALGEYESAAQHLREAMEWFDRLGMKPDYLEAQETQHKLNEQIQQRATAR